MRSLTAGHDHFSASNFSAFISFIPHVWFGRMCLWAKHLEELSATVFS